MLKKCCLGSLFLILVVIISTVIVAPYIYLYNTMVKNNNIERISFGLNLENQRLKQRVDQLESDTIVNANITLDVLAMNLLRFKKYLDEVEKVTSNLKSDIFKLPMDLQEYFSSNINFNRELRVVAGDDDDELQQEFDKMKKLILSMVIIREDDVCELKGGSCEDQQPELQNTEKM